MQALEEELEKKRRGVAALEEDGRAVFGGDKGKTRRAAGLNADKAALEARARPGTLPTGVPVPAHPGLGVLHLCCLRPCRRPLDACTCPVALPWGWGS